MNSNTPIVDLGAFYGNHLFVKREDLIPFSFGGNKARKAELFFKEIDQGGFGSVVTYGTGSSNHCRVVANLCCGRDLPCYVISPLEVSDPTFNSHMIEMFGAEVISVPVAEVHETIETKLEELRRKGSRPYFIEGGGHGNTGTEAYVRCYEEIRSQEQEMSLRFSHIFFASGTGTTQAGLVCGKLLHDDDRHIIGISIARKNPRGRNVVLDSIRSYLGGRVSEEQIQSATEFVDDFTDGYGRDDPRVIETIQRALMQYGMPLDFTYTGKAFMGMTEYIKKKKIREENILFIHTGGTPLFFDTLRRTEL